MLTVFLASAGAWGFHAERLTHELEHAHPAAHAGSLDADSARRDGDAAGAHHSPVSDEEHALLHATAQAQPVPVFNYEWRPAVNAGIIRSHFVLPQIAHSTREPPFRPPRSTPPA